MNPFSYTEYRNIITMVSQHLPIKDFKDVLDYNLNKFCVIRHDIEFSIDRSLILARIEKELDITSTYTVQLRNNTYNALSQKNIESVQEIEELGHQIGLHQNPPKMSDKELKKWLETNWTDEAGISKVFGTQLKTASKEASKRKIKWKKK